MSARCRVATLGTATALLAIGALACSPDAAGDSAKLPPDIPDPAAVKNERGALAFYGAVHQLLPPLVDWFIAATGVLTDELAALPVPIGGGGPFTPWDSRMATAPPKGASLVDLDVYDWLHQLRGQAREARGFLATYAEAGSGTYNVHDLQGHLYALEGYAEIFLADLYCSGIPLSTVDFEGDYTLTPGFPTAEVYQHAAELFDSALGLLHDSTSVLQLAAVGKGRALLAIGRYGDAAAAVAGVPDGYQYQVTTSEKTTSALQVFASLDATHLGDARPLMANQEGGTGLPYRSGDPRTLVDTLGKDALGRLMYFPAKYPSSGPVAFTLADAVEARLIEAEAALQGQLGGADWLARLNALRTDGTFDLAENGDTLWHAGTGGTQGLRVLRDPSPGAPAGPTQARVDLLFRERAFWLYLTAHRQGDLRRLLRQYVTLGYVPDAVYPSGSYPGGTGAYGNVIVAEVPAAERRLNSKYTGCIHGQA